jgi:hypothetical protein
LGTWYFECLESTDIDEDMATRICLLFRHDD